jgi:UDP-3-O-[3-hydroxymyristoyl] glucosamine N-acyltransferase
VTIGDRVMVMAKAGIHHDLKDDEMVGGIPAVDVRKFRRYAAVLTRLPEVIRRVRALENHVGIGGNDA